MMKREGFTIVELLIAMLILGVVLSGLLAMITGTLNFSVASVSSSDRLRELNDVTGYMADSIRRASAVLTSSTVNASSAPGSGVCNINSTTMPCFSVVVSEAVGGTAINKYTQLFYRVEPRSQLPSDYKEADGWADSNTQVIKEYRRILCDSSPSAAAGATPCTLTPPAALATASNAQWYLVIDCLTLNNTSGTYQPFAYNSATGEFTLQFRVADHRRGTTRYTPNDAPYSLTVVKRN